jgi:hypothetical protein
MGWMIDFGGGWGDFIGVDDGSSDISSMPRQITEDAARWLGRPPVFRLALQVGSSKQRQKVADQIISEFARQWPCVLSDHTANPVVPLGALAKGRAPQASQQGQKSGWRRFFGG